MRTHAPTMLNTSDHHASTRMHSDSSHARDEFQDSLADEAKRLGGAAARRAPATPKYESRKPVHLGPSGTRGSTVATTTDSLKFGTQCNSTSGS